MDDGPLTRDAWSGQEMPPVSSLALVLNNTCNLNCSYCFGDYGQPKIVKRMSLDIARRAVETLIAEAKKEPSRSGYLSYWGGEPMLSYRTILEIHQFAQRLASEMGVTLSYGMTTNGSAIDREQFDLLRGLGIRIQLSMDGPREVQDAQRPSLRGNSSSYDKVVGFVSSLSPDQRAGMQVRATLTATNDDPHSLHRFFRELGFGQVCFSHVSTKRPDLKIGPDAMRRILERWEEMADSPEVDLSRLNPVREVLGSLNQDALKKFHCGAVSSYLSVSPEGRYFFCHRFDGKEGFDVGDVFSGVDQKKRWAFFTKLDISHRDPCHRCSVRNLCGGGCYHEHLQNAGSIENVDPTDCSAFRRVAILAMKDFVRKRYHDHGEDLTDMRKE